MTNGLLLIGLTGSIGMGKSTTAQIFREYGVPVHDADAAVHEVYASKAPNAIKDMFPEAVSEDVIDRRKLASIVLNESKSLQRLEALIHPLVIEHRRSFIRDRLSTGAKMVVCDIPLLFETGADREMDLTIVVSASESVQKARVMQRDGMTAERFSAIMAKQLPDAEKRRLAHLVIDTGTGIESARRQVAAFLRAIGGRAQSA